jgi:hypothetical protein
MSDQDGLSNEGTQTSGTGESRNGGNEMNEENNDIAQCRIVTTAKDNGIEPEFWNSSRTRLNQALMLAF